jgi:sarcosine oxidase subunit beta
MKRMRAAIIGGGIIGCSIAYSLTRKGIDVTVIDRLGAVGHGSTSASSAIIRCFYSVPEMIAVANEGAKTWLNWPDFIGPINDDLISFERPGMLFIPPVVDASTDTTVMEMRRLGIRVEFLSGSELKTRFPFLETSSLYPPRRHDDENFFVLSGNPISGAIYEADAGYVVSPGLAALNFRSAGEREGVAFLMGREVITIGHEDSGTYTLQLSDGSVSECDILINAAGPHSAVINKMAGVTLPLTTKPLRQEVHAIDNPLFNAGESSGVPIVGDMESGVYWRPDRADQDLIIGSTEPECDELEWIDDPDNYETNLTERWWQNQSYRLMKRFPQVRQTPARGIAALYDVTVDDWYPIVDRTDRPGYFICIGTSGSSFKTSPVLGQLLADIIEFNINGHDSDQESFDFKLAYTGHSVNATFLSRNRGNLNSSGTVMG